MPLTADIASDLARRLVANEPCWFPGLAETLVAGFWADMPDQDKASYSTTTWLGGIGPVVVAVPGHSQISIEPMPARFAERFDVPTFADAAFQAASDIASALERLAHGHAGVAVEALIRSIHIILPSAPGYDCSHSEPTIPFSVFVSVPSGERNATLRLAESLLHEAMHLQLTLIERLHAVVADEGVQGYSPWQQRQRPLQGLVHGLYVFAAISQWLSVLTADQQLSGQDRTYVDRRLREIGEEIDEVSALAASPALTDFGRGLVQSLLDPSRRYQ